MESADETGTVGTSVQDDKWLTAIEEVFDGYME